MPAGGGVNPLDEAVVGLSAAAAARERQGRDSTLPRGRTYLRPRSGWEAPRLRELWHGRELIALFAVRDVTVRYRQTFFGVLWALLVPVVQLAIFTVFFGRALNVSGRVDLAVGQPLPYPLFVLSGLIVWNLFKGSLDGAGTSLQTHAHVLRKVYLPRLVLPLAALGRPALDAAVAFGLMTVLAAWYGMEGLQYISVGWLAAPLLLGAAAVAGLAIGMNLAALSIKYRDLQHVLPVFTSLLFFVTPVIYSVRLLPPWLAWAIYLNPVVGFLEAHRAAVLGLAIDWTGLAASAAVTSLLLVVGLLFFARAERDFADVV